MTSRDTDRLHHKAWLPNWLQPHMESARFLLADEPTRRRTLVQMCAYIAVEQALERQGQYVVFSMITRGLPSNPYEEMRLAIIAVLKNLQVNPLRIKIENDRLTIKPNRCTFCKLPEDTHDALTNKCLFDAASFSPQFIQPLEPDYDNI